jgi:hypothetical protein
MNPLRLYAMYTKTLLVEHRVCYPGLKDRVSGMFRDYEMVGIFCCRGFFEEWTNSNPFLTGLNFF